VAQKTASLIFISILSVVLFGAVSPIIAAGEAPVSYELLTPLPGIEDTPGSGKVTINDQYLEKYFKQLYKMGIMIATGLAVLMIMWGGVEYMTTDAMGGKEEGKEKIQSAVMGLLLALGSFIILRTIDPNLVNVNVVIDRVDTGKIQTSSLNITYPAVAAISQMPPYRDLGNTSNLGAAAGTVITGNATCYYVLDESKYVGQPKSAFFLMADGSKIPANNNFLQAGKIEGTVRLINGTVLNYHSGSGENYKWKVSSGWGEGAYRPLTPWRSVAADPTVFAPGSKLFIQQLAGMAVPGAGTHDGVFFVDDVGSAIKGNHIDIFTGTKEACDQSASSFSEKSLSIKILERK
jgi:3D (Asp-Asp-Asp) domain-containing protein